MAMTFQKSASLPYCQRILPCCAAAPEMQIMLFMAVPTTTSPIWSPLTSPSAATEWIVAESALCQSSSPSSAGLPDMQ